jgi:hypothetical protein
VKSGKNKDTEKDIKETDVWDDPGQDGSARIIRTEEGTGRK